MAKVVKKELGTYQRYHVDPWLDGRVWQLTQGEDFEDLASIRTAIYNKARYNGQKVRVRRFDGGLYVQAHT